MRTLRRYNSRPVARPVTLSGLEHRLSALTLWGFLGLVSLAGGALMALVTARVEAVPRDAMDFEFARKRENVKRSESGWRFSVSPDFDMFAKNGWTVVPFLDADGDSIFMVHSWGIPEVAPKDAEVPSWSRVSAPRSEDPRCLVHLAEIVYGWPMKSMVVEVTYPHSSMPRQARRYTVVGATVPPSWPSEMTASDWLAFPWFTRGFMSDPRPLEEILAASPSFPTRPGPLFPTRVIPLGFSVNTGFFALLIGSVLLALGLARSRGVRAARARRGACRTCGHPLAGLARCPECGRS